LKKEDIDVWLLHPGGVKILELLESSFGLSKAQTAYSWATLEEQGNMSSATLLYVLDRYTNNIPSGAQRALMVGVGPGLTVQLLLFERS